MLFRLLVMMVMCLCGMAQARVELGVERLFQEEGYRTLLLGKRVGLVTNQTGVDGALRVTSQVFQDQKVNLVALFAPEHGLEGMGYANEKVKDKKGKIPVYSLHGERRRPTVEMFAGIDVVVFDLQDVGVRSYTFLSTLCYVMEGAVKAGVEVVVLDRPNPMGGEIVDGAMLEEKWRSYIGYLNTPYCHGMTVGELARFFNAEYRVGCRLTVVPMKGWRRSMVFDRTGLLWVPTSPQVPESDTPFFVATTGLIGELGVVSIGIGYTLPFKVVGAPWIDGKKLASKLNEQAPPGVFFTPFSFRPFFGLYKGEDCHGVRMVITDFRSYRPTSTGWMVLGVIKALYPKEINKRLKEGKKDLFCKTSGSEQLWKIVQNERYIAWKLINFQKKEREEFLVKRQKYLLYD